MTIRLGPQACGTLDEAAKREWLVADGVGGYAMGTVAGLRTRRYHGLLAVAVDGPGSRMLGLVALDPVLVVGDARIRLATDEWASGTVDPRGHELLVSFDLDGRRPALALADRRHRARARARDARTARPTVGVVHRLVAADRPVRLELTPLCTWRSVHGERLANGDPGIEPTADGFVFEGAYRLAGAGWSTGGEWYRDVRAREEAARGLGDREDLWAAGTFGADLEPGGCHELTAAAASFDGRLPAAAEIVAGARSRARNLLARAHARDEIDGQLVLAADQFAIETGGRPTAVAGYPWFGEWSRDLMTSYEGIYLATEPLRRGPRGAAHVGRDRLRGDAGEHGRHRLARVQHGRRHALVRPRRRAPRVGHRRRRARGRARAGARGDRSAPRRRHALRHRASTRRTACCARGRTAWR